MSSQQYYPKVIHPTPGVSADIRTLWNFFPAWKFPIFVFCPNVGTDPGVYLGWKRFQAGLVTAMSYDVITLWPFYF